MKAIPHVIGNWKMYKTGSQAADYVREFLPLAEGCKAHLLLAVPFTSIRSAFKEAGSAVLIGAQNMHDANEGAFTGEIAASMLKEAGASFVLLGHSERRKLFKEDTALIHRKLKTALQEEILPVLCVGETLEEREQGREHEVLKHQLLSALEGIVLEDAKKLLIAYEPVWAIGTGKTATAEMAGEVHRFLRSLLSERFGKEMGSQIAILYGGSVNEKSVEGLMHQKEINGVLVGGASLDPTTFAAIAKKCASVKEHL